MDCGPDGANYPDCAWGGTYSGGQDVAWTRSFVAGGGPGGRDAVRYHLIGQSGSSNGCGNDMGWFAAPGIDPTPQGASRFYRYLMRLSRISGLDIPDACDSGWWGAKTSIVTSYEDSQRVINMLEADATHVWTKVCQNIGPPCSQGVPVPGSEWFAIQFEAQTSSTPDALDGVLRLWMNNDDPVAPSATATGAHLDTTPGPSPQCCAGGEFDVAGAFIDVSVSDFDIDVAAYEIDDEFDATWFARLGASQ